MREASEKMWKFEVLLMICPIVSLSNGLVELFATVWFQFWRLYMSVFTRLSVGSSLLVVGQVLLHQLTEVTHLFICMINLLMRMIYG